jgi:PAS domain S-box-containing protein
MALDLKQFLARGAEVVEENRVILREVPATEIGLTLLYVLFAATWSIFADDLLDWWMGHPLDSPALQTMKGINFVLVTGLVLYAILRRNYRDRRRAREASRLSQERFESVALATTGAIWDWNLNTNVVWWSDGLQQLFGYRSEDISSKVEWWIERLHPDDKERVTGAIRRVIASGGRTWAGQYRFRRQDGTYAEVLDRGFVLTDVAGRPVRIVGGVSDITEQRRAEEALENSRQQLRALSARLISGREEERTLVAREIHDELGQVLTALKINLDWLEKKIGARADDATLNPLLERLVESGEMVQSAIQRVQQIATELRPGALDTLGLAVALQQETRRFQERTGITCELQLPDKELELPREASTTVFRIFQEALTNVVRHAHATKVRITLSSEPNRVVLCVEDNGEGIRPGAESDSKSLGLLGMRERALASGGEVAITPIQPHGTRVTLRLPWSRK